MPISSIQDALTQYNANPPSTWNSGGAAACLDAVYYLLANRAREAGDQGTSMNYESLESVKDTLEAKLGTASPRAQGRKRRVRPVFGGESVQ